MEDAQALMTRIAESMAGDGKDPILAHTQVISKSEVTTKPRTSEDIDKSMGVPVAVSSDGRRFYTYLRNDGTGRLDVVDLSGHEVTYSFRLPGSKDTSLSKITLLRQSYGVIKALKLRHSDLLAEARLGVLDADAFRIVRMEISAVTVQRAAIFKEFETCPDPLTFPKSWAMVDMRTAAILLTKALDDTQTLIETHAEKDWLRGVNPAALPTIEITRFKKSALSFPTATIKPKTKSFPGFIVWYVVVELILILVAVITDQLAPSVSIYWGLAAIIIGLPLLGVFIGMLQHEYEKLKIKTRF